MSAAAPDRLAAVLAGVAALADEIVLGVDGRMLRAHEQAYRQLADHVVGVDADAFGALPHALHDACTGDWTLLLGPDEVVSVALARRLREHLAGRDQLADAACERWAIRRRWLFPDAAHWIDEVPWSPDHRLRLLRRGAAGFSDALLSEPPAATVTGTGYLDEPLYLLRCLSTDRAERQAAALADDVLRPGRTGVGHRPLHQLADPELFASLPWADVPSHDAAQLARCVPALSAPGSAQPQPSAPATARSADATVACLERDLRFHAGERRTVSFAVTNHSGRTWPAGGDAFVVSYRWSRPDGRLEDGPRTPFPVDVAPQTTATVPVVVQAPGPGRPDLVVDVVEEGVRWLGAALALRAYIRPPLAHPDRRPASAPSRAATHRGLDRGESPLPRMIHHVWLGGGDPPAAHRAFMDSWREHNPGWRVRLWTDGDAPVPPAAARARNIAERADLVRYELLRRHGGVYVDTDVECLRPIEPLVADTRIFAGYEIPGRLCNAVLGGVPGHRAFERLVALAARTVGTGNYPSATATVFLTRVLEPEPEATLFGPEVFYPYLWDEPRPVRTSFPNAWAVHHWAMSWQPGGG